MEVGVEKQILIILKKLISHINIEQMARLARKQLADMRAMEEEDMRMTMHGSGKHFYGAGATPSMGLSQFRGGAKKSKKYESESEESEEEMEDEMEGGRLGSLIGRLLPRTPSTSLIRGVNPYTRVYGRPDVGRPFGSLISSTPRQLATRLGSRFGPAAARAAALAGTVGALGSYFADQQYADDFAGYYDNYAGEDDGNGTFAPPPPPVVPPTFPPDTGLPDGLTPDELAWFLQSGNLPLRYASSRRRRGRGKLELEITHEGMKGGRSRIRAPAKKPKPSTKRMSFEEFVALAQGPIPYRQPTQSRPLGPVSPRPPPKKPSVLKPSVLKPVGGKKVSARAEIVRSVMRERGCSLPQASKIVKEEGLYTK